MNTALQALTTMALKTTGLKHSLIISEIEFLLSAHRDLTESDYAHIINLITTPPDEETTIADPIQTLMTDPNRDKCYDDLMKRYKTMILFAMKQKLIHGDIESCKLLFASYQNASLDNITFRYSQLERELLDHSLDLN